MMAAIALRLVVQVLLGVGALVALLWAGLTGKGWIAGFVYAAPLCMVAAFISPTPSELAAWREFNAQRKAPP
jgi:hypothetical protein